MLRWEQWTSSRSLWFHWRLRCDRGRRIHLCRQWTRRRWSEGNSRLVVSTDRWRYRSDIHLPRLLRVPPVPLGQKPVVLLVTWSWYQPVPAKGIVVQAALARVASPRPKTAANNMSSWRFMGLPPCCVVMHRDKASGRVPSGLSNGHG
jgi:hypothetical protein